MFHSLTVYFLSVFQIQMCDTVEEGQCDFSSVTYMCADNLLVLKVGVAHGRIDLEGKEDMNE